jgi:succinate dehydrogenase / fumarate reductase, membrane anchor subunit
MSKHIDGIGAKRTVSGAHYGLTDWLLQRVTAVIMVIFTLVLLFGFVFFTDKNAMMYDQWASLFKNPVMQILTFLTWLSLVYHAWIGIRDIWMDYVKPVGIRLALHVFTILWLLGCALYCAKILWSVA